MKCLQLFVNNKYEAADPCHHLRLGFRCSFFIKYD